jgi:hypothetical protein
MPSVVGLFREASFDPEAITLLSQAYETACKSLHDSGQPIIGRELIAERIIAAATLGERDPAKLCAFALNALHTKAELARKGFGSLFGPLQRC